VPLYVVYFVIDLKSRLKSRAVEIAGIVVDPDEAWMNQWQGS
jgi:hypothetical protein